MTDELADILDTVLYKEIASQALYAAARSKSQEWGDRIPIGLFSQTDSPAYEEQIPALMHGPLVKQEIHPQQLERLIAEFQ